MLKCVLLCVVVCCCVLICIISVFCVVFVDFVINNLPRFLGNISR